MAGQCSRLNYYPTDHNISSNGVIFNRGDNFNERASLSAPKSNSHDEFNKSELLNFLSLNVCGLKSKLKCPGFIDLLNKYCIVGLQETKCDDLDFVKNRKSITSRKSGGLALLVRKDISKYITIKETDSKLVLWFTLSKSLCYTENDIVCGIIYIPPEYSDFSVEDPFLEIQDDLNTFSRKFDTICLFGDFNS